VKFDIVVEKLKRPLRITSLDRAEDLEHHLYVLLFSIHDWPLVLVLTLLRLLLFVIVTPLILSEGAEFFENFGRPRFANGLSLR